MANLSQAEVLRIGAGSISFPAQSGTGKGDDSESVTVQALVPVSGLAAAIPAQGDPYLGDRAVLGNALGFVGWRWRGMVGDRMMIDLEYAYDPGGKAGSLGDGDANLPAVPDDEIDGNASGLEIPLPRHPLWATTSATLDGDALKDLWDEDLGRLALPPGHSGIALGLQGMSAFIVGTYQVTHTEYYAGNPPTLIGLIGTRAVPPGEGGASANWLIVSGSKRKPNRDRPFGSRTLVYLYSDDPGFPTGIYT